MIHIPIEICREGIEVPTYVNNPYPKGIGACKSPVD
jgi:hypothetical protein